MRKLEAAITVANERKLIVVILGDLFDDPVERDEGVKTRLIRILKNLWAPAVCNVGNHDIAFSTLSDEDRLAMFGAADVLDVVRTSGPVFSLAMPNGKRIGIGVTPYGQDIPLDVHGVFSGVDGVLWVTHHDIASEGAYPGAVPPFAIEGCKFVINGHIHANKPTVKVGGTAWFNPGNINRQTKDLIDETPRVWALGVASSRIEPVDLPFLTDVFDLTGLLVTAADVDDAVADLDSAFVSLLGAESATELTQSADGSVVREEIDAKIARDGTSESVKAVLLSLLQEAVARRVTATL